MCPNSVAPVNLNTDGVDSPASPDVIAVVGPTATGKSDLGITLAHHLGGDVINADAMQLYRGMDIGTAKLSMSERGGVPHHVFDIWDITQAASVVEYQNTARSSIAHTLAAGRVPIVVGGSGLYVRAALDDLEFPGTDPQVRAALEAELATLGSIELHKRLAERDPAAAAAILPSNSRRIVRALEVITLTNAPFTASLPEPKPVYRAMYIGLDQPSEVLDARVNERVEKMWRLGLPHEVAQLEKRGLREGPTASRAIGYSQVLSMFDGELTQKQAIEQTQQATRRFIRRQRSWFRRDTRIQWRDPANPELIAWVLAQWSAGRESA